MTQSLDHVRLRTVDTLSEAGDFLDWIEESRPYICVDTETTGLDWHLGSPFVRMVQFGDRDTAWGVGLREWRALCTQALGTIRDRRVPVVFHNHGFDMHALDVEDLPMPDWDVVHDTMTMHALWLPHESHRLKEAVAPIVGPLGALGERMLKHEFRITKTDWATVPIDNEVYASYGLLDVILTARLFDAMPPPGGEVYEREMAVSHICWRMERRGMRVDVPYTSMLHQQWASEAAGLAAQLEAAGIKNPRSNAQVTATLKELDWDPTIFTATGLPKLDKVILSQLAEVYPGVAEPLLRFRRITKWGSVYLEKFLENPSGRVHPSIKTLQARTGRMCLPDTYRLLTRRGALKIDDVVPGDETIDATGRWVRVSGVHRYPNQPTAEITGRKTTVEATTEHRWVQRTEKRPDLFVEPAIVGSRRQIVLAPSAESFDFFDLSAPRRSVASLVGWLASDGRVAEGVPGTGVGLRAHIYQTERKFYQHMLDSIPEPGESIMYDRLTTADHHEVRLRARWLRPVLEAEGLLPNFHDRLPGWVLRQDQDSCEDFFRAVWLADGSTAHPQNKTISCGKPDLREAIQIAAYRCGWSSVVRSSGMGGWSTKPRLFVKMRRPVLGLRTAESAERVADVWCVTTESGTFTAWNSDGPILTGNSITNPPLQTLPSKKSNGEIRRCIVPDEEHQLWSVDYQAQEPRIFAHYCKDPSLIAAINSGEDLYTFIARMVYEDPSLTRDDPIRDTTKVTMLAFTYGAGVGQLAKQTGLAPAEVDGFLRRLFAAFPGIRTLTGDFVVGGSTPGLPAVYGAERLRDEGLAYVTTAGDRKVSVPGPHEAYKLVNYLMQGSGRDVLAKALVRLDRAGLADNIVVPVHDECLFQFPEGPAGEEAARAASSIMADHTLSVDLPTEITGPLTDWGCAYRNPVLP